MKRLLITACAAILGLVMSSQAQAVIVIDEFDKPPGGQTVIDNTIGGAPPTSTVADASILGGSRKVTVNLQGGAAGAIARIEIQSPSPSNSLYTQAGIGTDGEFEFLYAGLSDDDLTQAGANTGFVFSSAGVAGGSLPLTITVEDVGGGLTAVGSFSIPSGFAGNFFMAFASFTNQAAFTSADSIKVEADPSAGLLSFSSAALLAATPEPASMTLLGIGLAGMLGYGARRRKKEKLEDVVS